jgi:hypothetical protein
MKVGIHKEAYGRFSEFLKRYEIILDFNGIDHIRLNASESDFWEKVKQLSLFIFRWGVDDTSHQIADSIISIIEKHLGISCLPNYITSWPYEDKIKEYYLLKQHGFPIVDTYVFWDKKAALAWLETATFPIIFKLKRGAGSKNVLLIKNKKHVKRIVNKMFGRGVFPQSIDRNKFNLVREIRHIGGNILRKYRGEDLSSLWQKHKNYVLFQRYLADNKYDTRITVIGDRAFGFRRFNRVDDFRASGSGKIDYDAAKVDKRCIEVAFAVSKNMQFQTMAYDFLFTPDNEPQFSEISYTYIDTAIYNCPGYWDSNLYWHEGHFWPQYFQLMDALDLPTLKQPEIKL